MPPGVPGREAYDPVEGHAPFATDAEKAKQILADSGNEGFEIKFLFSTDSDISVASKDVLVKGLEAAGFKATPVATTIAKNVADRDDINGDINLRSYGWCSDWPSGATWVPPIFQSTDLEEVGFGTNESAFNNPEIDAKINAVFALPAEEQPAAWNDLEQEIMTTYLPGRPALLHRRGADARLADRGLLHRQHPRYADVPRHVGERRLTPVALPHQK